MIAYGFQHAFGPQLESGGKTLTMRQSRKPPSRHATVGEPIGLWTGLRTKEARRRGVGIVTFTCLVRFEENGIRYVSDLRVLDPHDRAAEALQAELLNHDNDPFARRDGFENWSNLWAWHRAHRTADEKRARDQSIVRHVIAWRPLSADAAAALDAGAPLEEVA